MCATRANYNPTSTFSSRVRAWSDLILGPRSYSATTVSAIYRPARTARSERVTRTVLLRHTAQQYY
jgi:hypothetical protein